uniref:Kelch-like protein 10 n=1 Tax=Echeneis naucrates TaxID=173247 RepID=A0A665UHI1_ECHNA
MDAHLKMSESSWVQNELRREQQLCDAVIRVDGVEFYTHKLILSNCSPYFRALFTHWSTPDSRVFDIPNVSLDMMRLIIEFAYTGSVPVTQENIQEVFVAADRFAIAGILKACSQILEEQLDVQNCISIWWFTDLYYHPELKHKAFLFILKHFEEVAATSGEFLLLSAQELAKIIENDQLNVKKEQSVFEAVLHWISSAPEKRREYSSLLLSKVRLSLISPEYIMENVNDNEVVKASEECRRILLKTIDVMLDVRAKSFSNSIVYDHLVCPRLPPQILLAIGGWTGGHPSCHFETYNVRAERWVSIINEAKTPVAYHGTAFINTSVYCVGGFDGVFQFNTVHRFDMETHTWHEVAPMHFRRCYVSVTVMDGYIYAMGGFDGHIRLKTAERYEPRTNQWTLIASMNEQRSDASCTTLHGKIYICGGFNGNDCLSTAECYNPKTNQWTLIASMDSRRSGVGVTTYAGRVFAVGGFNGTSRLHTAEAYNPDADTWQEVSPMLNSRSHFGIAVIDDRVFVVGGFNGLSTIPNVECFDIKTGVWSETVDMEVSCSALSCCVVNGLNNMAEYAADRLDCGNCRQCC